MNIAKREDALAIRAALCDKLETLRQRVTGEAQDARVLFDEVTALEIQFHNLGQAVPDLLRDLLAELEANIVEDFYDNLPV